MLLTKIVFSLVAGALITYHPGRGSLTGAGSPFWVLTSLACAPLFFGLLFSSVYCKLHLVLLTAVIRMPSISCFGRFAYTPAVSGLRGETRFDIPGF
ncbi:hypothetical protein L209DRAFT_748662 [Thermothelomyces heterothallicus CBS 203.75]